MSWVFQGRGASRGWQGRLVGWESRSATFVSADSKGAEGRRPLLLLLGGVEWGLARRAGCLKRLLLAGVAQIS